MGPRRGTAAWASYFHCCLAFPSTNIPHVLFHYNEHLGRQAGGKKNISNWPVSAQKRCSTLLVTREMPGKTRGEAAATRKALKESRKYPVWVRTPCHSLALCKPSHVTTRLLAETPALFTKPQEGKNRGDESETLSPPSSSSTLTPARQTHLPPILPPEPHPVGFPC